MRSKSVGFTLIDLLIVVAIIGILAAFAMHFMANRERRAGIGPTTGRTAAPETYSKEQPANSPYSDGGEFVCEGVYDRASRECAADEICETYLHFADGSVCVVHDAHPLNITAPRGTRIRVTLRRIDTFRIEPVPTPSAEKPAE